MLCAASPHLRSLLLILSVIGASSGCLQDPASAYRFTGTVCRLTYPAAVVCEWNYFRGLFCFFSPSNYYFDYYIKYRKCCENKLNSNTVLTFIHHNQVCENALSEIFVPVHEELVAG